MLYKYGKCSRNFFSSVFPILGAFFYSTRVCSTDEMIIANLAQSFWKIVEKPTVASFQLMTRNLNILLCTLPILCTSEHVQRPFTNLHLKDK